MANCNILYSVNTFLAYKINEQFYKGTHYVWCAPKFNCEENPPSSNPKEIMRNLMNEVQKGDLHSYKIEQNRMGLLNGVEVKGRQNIINDHQKKMLIEIITKADIRYFRPILYIIPYNKIKKKIISVDCLDKADWFSEEYKIENLLSKEFDVIELN